MSDHTLQHSASDARIWLREWKQKHGLDPKTKLPRYGSQLLVTSPYLGTWCVTQTETGLYEIRQIV